MTAGTHILTVSTEPCVNESGELHVHIIQQGEAYYAVCSYAPGCLEGELYGEKTLTWNTPLDAEWVLQIQHELRGVHVPVVPVFYAGHGGTVYEVGLGDYMGAATYRWWGAPPRGWEALGVVHRRVVDGIDIPRLVPLSEAP